MRTAKTHQGPGPQVFEYLVAMSIVICLAWLAWGDLRKQQAVKNSWRRVRGRIVEAGTRQEMRRMPKTGCLAPMYSPAIRYCYTVGDREYTGTRISFNNDRTMWYSKRSWAASRGRKWKTGRIVDVYHDPDNPARACLAPVTGVPYLYLFFLILWMAVLTLFGVIMH